MPWHSVLGVAHQYQLSDFLTSSLVSVSQEKQVRLSIPLTRHRELIRTKRVGNFGIDRETGARYSFGVRDQMFIVLYRFNGFRHGCTGHCQGNFVS